MTIHFFTSSLPLMNRWGLVTTTDKELLVTATNKELLVTATNNSWLSDFQERRKNRQCGKSYE
jgi:hypothetical protein